MNRRTEISTLNNKNAYQVPGNCRKSRETRNRKLREFAGICGNLRETGKCGKLREFAGNGKMREIAGICGKQEFVGNGKLQENAGNCGKLREIAGCEKREIAGILWEFPQIGSTFFLWNVTYYFV